MNLTTQKMTNVNPNKGLIKMAVFIYPCAKRLNNYAAILHRNLKPQEADSFNEQSLLLQKLCYSHLGKDFRISLFVIIEVNESEIYKNINFNDYNEYFNNNDLPSTVVRTSQDTNKRPNDKRYYKQYL